MRAPPQNAKSFYLDPISTNLSEAGNFEEEITVLNWEHIYSTKHSQLNFFAGESREFLLAYLYPVMSFQVLG